MYLFGVAAAGWDAAWTFTGALVIFGLLVGYSVPFMENRMKRHAGWKEYVEKTSSFFPMPSLIQKV